MTQTRSWLAVPAAALLLAGCGIQSIPQAENAVSAAWAETENQYQRRADLVPNLVETVKGYAAHERETLEAVVNARARATQVKLTAAELTPENLGKFEKAQAELGGALGRLLAVAENYPQLKANENFQFLQQRISGLENGIADRRELYNEAVNLNNVRIEQFPDVLIARMFGFRPAELLVFSEAEKADVDIKSLFN